MAELSLAWNYLTGYAVATDTGNRQRAEWPPHPGRVFMALAAAWFETQPPGDDADGQQAWNAEGEALRWLEALGDPQLVLPPPDHTYPRSVPTVYVPVNDRAGPSAATIQSAPVLTRSKQPRTFPCTWVGDAACVMHWRSASDVDRHRPALVRLCSKVTRIGHSSSLVHIWVDDHVDESASEHEKLTAAVGIAEMQARSISPGLLDMLADRFGAAPRRRHTELSREIEQLKASKKAIKGKGANVRKAAIDEQIAARDVKLAAITARPPLRPTLGTWCGYARADRIPKDAACLCTHFDTDMLVLSQIHGPQLPAASTLAVTQALRETIMKQSPQQPVPAWTSGHAHDGKPLASNDGHMACIPLPVVGHQHADGHLLGVGLVFPKSITRAERGRVLGKVLLTDTGEARELELKLGRLGVWTVSLRDWTDIRRTLDPEQWTARPKGADTWASVTPVVLDRFPKSDMAKDRTVWTREVAGIIAAACRRIGLPEPLHIDVDTTSWHRGSPRAIGKRRPLRGHPNGGRTTDASLGDGFPAYPPKGTKVSRPQVHVWLRFREPVLGPVLLAAGRYRGYGLCKPWKERRQW